VGVPAAAGVALRRDQHMLAQSGEQMTTDRTAIRRRLAVRRKPDRPPWRGGKSRHASILAPLVATVAATMAVGVGVAVARAGRERLDERARRRERQLGLLPGEPLGDGLRRMALGQVDLSVDLLGGRGGKLDEAAVHETRKALKRLRALVRMLAHELGEDAYSRESDTLRGVARRLSGARDSEVMLATLDALVRRHPDKLRGRRGVVELRQHLAAEHARMERRSLRDESVRAAAIDDLLVFRARVSAWELPPGDDTALVEPGLRRIYKQGRRRYRRAGSGRRRTAAMHEWRKRVKDLRYAAEMLQRDPPGPTATVRGVATIGRQRKRARANSARLHKLERRADSLGELLGEEHDLALLAALIDSPGPTRLAGERPPKLGRRTRKVLLKLIKHRRRRLQRRALKAGRRLHSRSPREFLAMARAAYVPARSG